MTGLAPASIGGIHESSIEVLELPLLPEVEPEPGVLGALETTANPVGAPGTSVRVTVAPGSGGTVAVAEPTTPLATTSVQAGRIDSSETGRRHVGAELELLAPS